MSKKAKKESQESQDPDLEYLQKQAENADFSGEVQAIATGFYGLKRRRVGERFFVEAGAYSDKWMKPFEDQGKKSQVASADYKNPPEGKGSTLPAGMSPDMDLRPDNAKPEIEKAHNFQFRAGGAVPVSGALSSDDVI